MIKEDLLYLPARIVSAILRSAPTVILMSVAFWLARWQLEGNAEAGESHLGKTFLLFLLMYGGASVFEALSMNMANIHSWGCTRPIAWLFEALFVDGRNYQETHITRFPKALRRLLARTTIHRAWVQGAALGRWVRRQEEEEATRSRK